MSYAVPAGSSVVLDFVATPPYMPPSASNVIIDFEPGVVPVVAYPFLLFLDVPFV